MKFAKQTIEKMRAAEEAGFQIIIGNNPFLDKRKKYAGFECIRLAQTNDRQSGFCKRTVWAIREKQLTKKGT